jgi:hypothetical protein
MQYEPGSTNTPSSPSSTTAAPLPITSRIDYRATAPGQVTRMQSLTSDQLSLLTQSGVSRQVIRETTAYHRSVAHSLHVYLAAKTNTKRRLY